MTGNKTPNKEQKRDISLKNRSVFKRVVREFSRFIPLIATGVAFALIQQTMRLGVNEILGRSLDFILGKDGIDPLVAIWFILAFSTVRGIGSCVTTYCMGKTSNAGIYGFAVRTVNHIKRLPMAFLERHASGDFVSRINNDIGIVREFIGRESIRLIEASISLVAIMCYYIYKNWLIGIVTIFLMVVCLPIFNRAMKNNQRLQKKTLVKKGDSTAKASDILQGIRETKAFNAREKMAQEYEALVEEEQKAAIAANTKENNGFLLSRIISQLPSAVVLGLGGYLVLRGETTIGTVFTLNISLFHLSLNSFVLFETLTLWRKVTAASERVFEIIDTPDEYAVWGQNSAAHAENDTGHGDIVYSLKNVSFAYPSYNIGYDELGNKEITEREGKNVLSNISLDIKKGETVAFVGRSGCGKTTLLKLLAGFYKLDTGKIIKHGRDMSELPLDDIRADVAMVSQDSFLFPVTVYNNILYGKGFGDAGSDGETVRVMPDGEVEAAAKAANIHDFLVKQPKGYESLVGERGIKLSGGQRQKVAIARALIKNADILLLDEPTSALDTESEYHIQETLDRLMQGKTSVVVAHRLSSIKGADRIYVFDEGEIAENGTHNKLLERKGLYFELYQKQLDETREVYA